MSNNSETFILTGSNGFVGTAVLLRLLALSELSTSFPRLILPLRRPLPESHPALTHPAWPKDVADPASPVVVLVLEDLQQAFADPSSTLSEYARAASTMIWCVGGRYTDFPSHSLVDYVHMTHTIPLTAAKSFSVRNTSETTGAELKEKTIVLCSGAWVDRDETAGQGWFTIESITRDVKGRTERDLLALPGVRMRIFRPAGIIPAAGEGRVGNALMGAMTGMMTRVVVRVDAVAAAMVKVALEGPGEGDEEKDTWENSEIVRLGAKVLKSTPTGSSH